MGRRGERFKFKGLFHKSMNFKEKYISVDEWDNQKPEEQAKEKRKPIGNDAYAIGDIIQDLINKIEQAARVKFK